MDALLGEILRELEGEVENALGALEAMERKLVSEEEGEVEGEGGQEVQRKAACQTLSDRWRTIGEVVEWALGVLRPG